ncbi:hypothetical protein ANABIO32_07880 [Rossellomorea marisflavi]|uniref:DUF5344 family protein n=1 Tax=Rossellomorea marisflavi TaxID=189381 RepID=UPI0025C91739|nr:DUF5344 family protein [Rossellomorea marisflavi]GLI83098.1 hypothetical protein ANABIO32_07880 [Rossellomorea marisflavi]
MSTEIKIQYSETELAILNLHRSINAWNTNFPKQISGRNELEVINKLNKLNQQCQEMLETYQELLRENKSAMEQSVEEILHADQSLSSMMSLSR